jgi:hypothetical protein
VWLPKRFAFSFAITNGAQSVNAIKPNFAVVTSGASAAPGLAAVVGEDAEGVDLDPPQLLIKRAVAVVAPAVIRNFRLDKLDIGMNRDSSPKKSY